MEIDVQVADGKRRTSLSVHKDSNVEMHHKRAHKTCMQKCGILIIIHIALNNREPLQTPPQYQPHQQETIQTQTIGTYSERTHTIR